MSCLYYLYKGKTLTAKELCDICSEDKANISRTIKFLEKSGFIKCESNAKKRYQSGLFLTKEGVLVAKSMTEKIDAVLKQASNGLTEESRVIFYNTFSLICSNLEKICKEYKD